MVLFLFTKDWTTQHEEIKVKSRSEMRREIEDKRTNKAAKKRETESGGGSGLGSRV